MTKILTGRVANKIRRVFRRVQNNSYNLTKAIRYCNISKSYEPDYETVIIYQMGKVGSSSIKYSLKQLDRPMNLYHVHALTHKRLNWLKNIYKNASQVSGKAVIHDHVVEGMFVRKLMDQNEHPRWKVITLVRDPIARNISTFFQSLDIFFPEWVKQHRNKDGDLLEHLDELIALFLNEANHKLPLKWFDSYFKPVFDLDIYEHKFPFSKGYQILSNNNVELMLMRLEDLDRCAGSAFYDFLGIENFTLKKTNITSEKADSKVYAHFKESIKLPESYIDEMYSSKFVQHFYTQSEIDRFRAQWSR